MPIGYSQLPELLPVPGVRLSAVAAGIRYQGRNDLVLMELSDQAQVAAVFTRNAFCAAPVVVARAHLASRPARYLLINSGNANAGTGEPGMIDARQTCTAVADRTGCDADQVLPFSTGVIGERLAVERIKAAIDPAVKALAEDAWPVAANAIMTTDTVAKGISKTITLDGATITLTGIAKGSGMIRPDMATMLAFIATDAGIEAGALRQALSAAVESSFNRITVDGDTSTNDACVVAATGTGMTGMIDTRHTDYPLFCAALTGVCERLAELIVRDGEGASKFVTVRVGGGADAGECLRVAYTVAHSPLVKTALFASDPNWGRILAAVGRAGLDNLQVDAVQIYLDDVCIVRDGGIANDYRESDGQRVMDQEEITIDIRLGRGTACERVWTTDLSHEYVRINAEYRS